MPSQRIMAVHLPTGPYVYLSRLWSNNSSMKRCAGPCCSWPSRLRRFSTFWGSQGMSMNVDDTIPTIKRRTRKGNSKHCVGPRVDNLVCREPWGNCHRCDDLDILTSSPLRSPHAARLFPCLLKNVNLHTLLYSTDNIPQHIIFSYPTRLLGKKIWRKSRTWVSDIRLQLQDDS
ncbi:hypothetical protein MPTK1_8g07490 [Marchantia polymorpha subsp. ruderalis]|uniref:Uncharacterized protein n=1 Tax=Marchantia polymorpha TaxID=3197 RepID=A0A2R6XI77_MARPO|nr:hypothetical protein MARPO_0013s0044 [Marchantia polymorpha]BBN19035.1 hypothetical protein Mp_8g07490 [Marchantia polymorpha subsp. ruderalis]|eukprot:PTQ45811.1 hypothetical protein MARPO_0013s0044 [Marchantia polymorpha]